VNLNNTASTTLDDLSKRPESYSIFELRHREFSGEAAKERATFFRDQQKSFWLGLFGDPSNADNFTSRIFSAVTAALQQPDLFTVNYEGGDSFVVRGNIPLLDDERASKAIELFNTKTLAAAIVVECRKVFYSHQLAQIFNTELLMLVVNYANGGLSPSEIQPYVARQKVVLAGLASDLLKTSSDASDKTANFSRQAADLLKEKSEEFDALKKSVGESIRLGSSATLWRNKATWHQVGFIFWFAVFTAAVCSVGWYIIGHISEIAAAIPKDKDGVITYYSLVFFIVPVIAIGWLLRLLSRFINNQLVLLDDAQHRDVMTKTYLALVGDKDSRVDEKDRLVMLSAIFRPLPGAQIEDVAPPTILDLLKKN
jgi:hypothetical protein